MIFSHTIKAQPYNMPFLDACLARNVRLFDYECIRAPENEGGQRLVAFGKYAGLCGMVDGFRGLGARLLAREEEELGSVGFQPFPPSGSGG